MEYPLSDFKKIFIPSLRLIANHGEDAFVNFVDKKKKKDRHLVLIPQGYIDSLDDLSRRSADRRQSRRSRQAMDFVWTMISRSNASIGQPVRIGDNLFLLLAKEGTLEDVLNLSESSKDELRRKAQVVCYDSTEASRTYLKGLRSEIAEFDRVTPQTRLEGVKVFKDDGLYGSLCNDVGSPAHIQPRVTLPLSRFPIDSDRVYPNQYFVVEPEAGAPRGSEFIGQVLGPLRKNMDGEWIMDKSNLEVHLLQSHALWDHGVLGIRPKDLQQALYLHALSQPHITRIIATGGAGSGKSLLAYASLLYQTLLHPKDEEARALLGRMQDKTTLDMKFLEPLRFNEMFLVKADSRFSEDIGYLPGDTHQKLLPFIKSFEDAHRMSMIGRRIPFWTLVKPLPVQAGGASTVMTPEDRKKLREMMDKCRLALDDSEMLYVPQAGGLINIEDWGLYQGRTLARSALFIDETQNLDEDAIHQLVTRIAPGSLVVMAGDYVAQIINRRLSIQDNGLFLALQAYHGKDYSTVIALPGCYRDRGAKDAIAMRR